MASLSRGLALGLALFFGSAETWGFEAPRVATASSPDAGRPPLSAFAESLGFMLVALSPSGRAVATVSWTRDRPEVSVSVLDESGRTFESRFTEALPPSLVGELAWASDDTLIVSYTASEPPRKGASGKIERTLARISKERGLETILRYEVNRYRALAQDYVLHPLPEDREHILYQFAPEGGDYPGIYEVNVLDGAIREIEETFGGVHEWSVDWQGVPRLAVGAATDGRPIVRFRPTPSSEWDDLSQSPVFKGGQFLPLGFSGDGTAIYVRSSIGTGRAGIYQFDMPTKRILRRLFDHPRVDAMGLILAGRAREPLAATYVDDVLEFAYFDASLEALDAKLAARLKADRARIYAMSMDGGVLAVIASTPPYPDDLYLYVRDLDALHLVKAGNASLKEYALPKPRKVSYFTADGLEIPAYLTTPLGVASGPRPAIVLPHGGPWARDDAGYNEWSQFFASLGFTVLQPNFRGSSGYGTLYQALGYGQWGEAMLNDLADGIRWLLAEGVADPARICVVGGSYGGHAALMAAVKLPHLIRCSVAFAPVTDLRLWLDSMKETPAHTQTAAMVMGGRGAAYLRDNSPAAQAKRTGVPVLLLHGESDLTVPIEHSLLMEKALRRGKRPVEFVPLSGESHHLLREDNRLIALKRMAEFLDKHIGSGASDDSEAR